MLDAKQKNLCLRIARGDIKEEEIGRKLTSEEKAKIEYTKKLIEIHKKNGREDLVKAMCIDE